ncbi:acyltransferase domain-containing protein [Streptomyces platensis]|uniref:acyltransferase domain-containing protein n=1 Tax=Streptomyces platensis TaxID=58346 RepID=UPI00386EF5F0|nr:acyltransferase domain-containing protein [Streptomyces platensis]
MSAPIGDQCRKDGLLPDIARMTGASAVWTAEDVANWIVEYLGEELELRAAEVDRGATFSSLGLGSQAAAAMVGRLGRRLGRDLPVATLWAFPTVNRLAAAAVSDIRDSQVPPVRTVGEGTGEPLAVVSMAARLPGAESVGQLWKLILAGEDAIGSPPAERFGDGAGSMPDAGYLRQRLDEFDHRFFHLTVRETAALDPVQRLFLEVCWEAIEASSLPRTGLPGSATGVYVGSIWNEFGAASRPGQHTMHTATGSSLSMVANRVSYTYDLRGPSFTLDSACSSSLVAVHLAAQALRRGEIDAAIVGGVNLLQSPATTADLLAFGGLAPDGHCKAFAADADGFGRGEGAVALVLKRLADAERDGDHIWCLLHGSAVNNDGHTNGLTAPSPVAQQAVIREAHAQGGTDPRQVRFVETHGTGTALGDPIEAMALAGALRGSAKPVQLGTLKANIGHLEGAAGVAGLVKAALVMHYGIVPPCILRGETNPHIDLRALNLAITSTPVELPSGDQVLGGVSSFGWGGTNAHVVVGRYHQAGVSTAVADARESADRASNDGSTAFVFSPFGGQWKGMGRDLLRSDAVFRTAVSECDRGANPVLGLSVLDLIASGADLESYGVAVCQSVVYAIQVGLARSLAARGVRPAVVVGHSLGEIAGAVAADALTATEGGRIVAHYGVAQQRLVGRGGGMAVVALSLDALAPYLASRPDVVVAGMSSACSTNLSGPAHDLDELLSVLSAKGHKASRINVGLAAHSPAIDEVRDDLVGALGQIDQYPPKLPMVSALDGQVMAAGAFSAEYFATALREPVDFAAALAHPLMSGADVVVEINAHPILGSALRRGCGEHVQILPAYSRDGEGLTRIADTCRAVTPPQREMLLTLSGHSAAALAQRCREVAQWWPEDWTPASVVPTLSGLSTLGHRASVVVSEPNQTVEGLRERADGLSATGEPATPVSDPRVVFVFPGQGGQWRGMGRDLYESDPVFARHLRRCDLAVRQACGAQVLPLLLEAAEDEIFTNVATVQPLLFAVQVALARTLEHYGAAPHAVVGHSMGEAAAAHVAGALSLHDAAAIIGRRSRLMDGLTGAGAMLATELTFEEAGALCAGTPAVSVAVSNSARSTVLSGAAADIERIAQELTERGVFNRPVRVQVASHSPQMDPLLPELTEAIADIAPRHGTLPLYSTVLGRVAEGPELDAGYWARNLRDPVLFADATTQLLDDGYTCFVEISPHPVLSTAVEETVSARDVLVVPSLRKDQPEWQVLLGALGRLHDAGVPVDHVALNPAGRSAPLTLPYPWQRVSSPILSGGVSRGSDPVGARAELPHDPSLAVHAGSLDLSTWSLGDHVIDGRVVVPAAAFAAVAMHVSDPGPEAGPLTVRDLALRASLEVSDQVADLQTTVRAAGAMVGVEFFGRDGDRWTQVAKASVERTVGHAPFLGRTGGSVSSPDELYAGFAERGLAFGPQYRRVRRLEVGASGSAADLDWNPSHTDPHLPVDPRLLDAVLQVAVAPLLTGPRLLAADQALLTTAIREVSVLARTGADPQVVATLAPGPSGTFLADADLVSDGRVTLRVRGAEIREVPMTAHDTADDTGVASLAEGLRALPAAERTARTTLLVRGVVGEVAGVAADQVDPSEPFRSIGLNSIMGLELRARLERLFGLTLSSTVVWNYPTADTLAGELAVRLGEHAEAPGPEQPQQVAAPRSVRADIVAADPQGETGDLAVLQQELAELEALMGEL